MTLSMSGYRMSYIQLLERYHHWTAVQWRAYTDSKLDCVDGENMFMLVQIKATRKDFIAFFSQEYDQNILSISYLITIARVGKCMESNSEKNDANNG